MIHSFFRRCAASLVFAVFFVTSIFVPVVQAAEAKGSVAAQPNIQINQDLQASAPNLDTATVQLPPVQNLAPVQDIAPAQDMAPMPRIPLPVPQAAVQGITPQDEPSKETKKGNLPVQINNASGAASYSFPLDIPSGRSGMQPSLNLSYNSDSHDNMSFFGVGWSLDIGSVTRTTRKGSDHLYTENDFTLSIFNNQKRLKPIALIDGKHGIYGAEIESDFEKIEFLADDSWLVTDKNGMTFTFGKMAVTRQDDPADATHIYKWALSEVRDANDNFIRFSYTKDGGQIIPDSIFYTGSGVADGIFEIDFIKEARPDVFSSNATQFTITNNFRINEIDIKVSGITRKQYIFTYDVGGNGIRSVLRNITQVGIDQEENVLALPPEIFAYNQKPKNWREDAAWRLPTAFESDNTDTGARFAEINGDGLPDIVISNANESRVYMNTGNGWRVDPAWNVPVTTSLNGNDNGIRFADVNGDGLADIVALSAQPNPQIYLNTGTGWQFNATWHFPGDITYNISNYSWVQIEDVNGDSLVDVIQQSVCCPPQGPKVFINNANGQWTADANWNFPVGEFVSPGAGLNRDMGVRFADVNGDSLVDVVQGRRQQPQGADLNNVYLNTGKGWRLDATRSLPFLIVDTGGQDLGVRFADANGDGLVDILKSHSTEGISAAYINTGRNWNLDRNWQLPVSFASVNSSNGIQIVDANGDGITDLLRGRNDPRDPNWNAAYIDTTNNNAQLDDVLTQVTEQESGTINVTYTPSTSYKDQQGALLNKVPFVLHTVSRIDRNDNLGAVSTETYFYESGSFYVDNADVYKNIFAGFAHVKNTSGTGDITSSNFFVGKRTDPRDHYSLMGRIYRQDSFENDGTPLGSTLFNFSHCDIGNGRYLVQLDSQVSQAFDPDGQRRVSATGYTYDADGNIQRQTQYGEVSLVDDVGAFENIGNDMKTQNFTYATDVSGKIRNAVSNTVTRNQAGSRISETHSFYDGNLHATVSKGNLTRGEYWLDNRNIFVSKDFTYDQFGNQRTQTDFKGNITTRTYDANNLYPTSETNSLNQTTTFEYDLATGKATQTRDPNGLTRDTEVDGFGRANEVLVNGNLTEDYNYGDRVFPNYVKKVAHPNANRTIETTEYFDGLGKSVQIRALKSADKYSVTNTKYDLKQRIDKKAVPVAGDSESFTPVNVENVPTYTFSYDGVDRITKIVEPIAQETVELHGWDKEVTDGNGHVKVYHQDAYGRLIAVDEFLNGVKYSTLYEYDFSGNLTKITDAAGNVRNFTYDSLGRALTAEDTHAPNDNTFARWTYTYDSNGNMLTKTGVDGKVITWTYDNLNRVLTENLSDTAGIDTTYVYDTAPNGMGKVGSVTKISGAATVVTAYEYDSTGNISKETRTINNENFISTYLYDRLNRVTEMTAPNGVVTTYTYNPAGLLQKIDRQNSVNGAVIPVIADKTYTAGGQVETIEFNNGVKSEFTYYDDFRLRTKITSRGAQILQNISYEYDLAGNIKTITEDADTHIKRRAVYTYDDLDRLETATITGTPNVADYNVTYTYDILGNITNKPGVGAYLYEGIGYANPHAVTQITAENDVAEQFTYDANGNLLTDVARTLAWNVKNELLSVVLAGNSTSFAYDHTGNRVLKTAPSGITKYVSQSYEIENKNGQQFVRNYIYDGSELVATIEDAPAESTVILNENFEGAPPRIISGNWTQTATGMWEESGITANARSSKALAQNAALNYSFQMSLDVNGMNSADKGAGLFFFADDETKDFGGNGYLLKQTKDSIKIFKAYFGQPPAGPVVAGSAPLEKPILLAPSNNTKVTTLTPTLQWFEPYNSPVKRNFQWYIKDATTGQIVWNRTLNNPDGGVAVCPIPGLARTWTCLSATVPAGKLQPGKTYLWAVEAKNGALSSGFSREASFSTEILHTTIALMPGPFANRAPSKPVHLGPVNGAVAAWPVTLRWRDGGDDNKPNLFRNYRWRITDNVTGLIVWNRTWDSDGGSGGPTSCQPLANRASSWTCLGVMVPDKMLQPGRSYSWSVEASDGTLSSGFTAPWIFTAPALPANIVPNKPALLTPVPNATVPLPVRLTWTDGGDSDNKPNTARNYQWKITDSATGQIVWNRTWNNADGGVASCPLTLVPTTTWKCTYANVPAGKLEPGKTYTWAVAASDGSLSSGYTNISTFTVSPNQNLLKEQASFAAPLNDANLHTYDIAYAPATGVMTIKRDSAVVGTFTDPQPLMNGNFVIPTSNLVKVDFDNLIVTADQPANAPPVRSVYYSHSDHLGSSSVVADSSGAIAQQLDYLPYGEERINEQAPAAGGTAPFDTKKKYTGKELDSETGLYYYGARYYDSRISRFISEDPAGINLSDIRSFTNPQGWNMYSYALNNPVRYNDPSGKVAESIFGKLLGKLVAPWVVVDEISNNSPPAGESIPQGWELGQNGWQCTSPPCGSWPTNEQGEKTENQNSNNGAVGVIGMTDNGQKGASSSLNKQQLDSLNKFESKLPKAAEKVTINDLPSGGKAFSSRVPANNIPGACAVYEKQVNILGKTVEFTKTVYNKLGEIIHMSDKIRDLRIITKILK